MTRGGTPTMTPTTYACHRCVWGVPVDDRAPQLRTCRKDTPRMPHGGTVGLWPLVRVDDWCGAFTPRRDA